MADNDVTEEVQQFKVDYALSSRSTCNSSKQLIPEGSLRIGVMMQSPKFDGMYPQWHKFEFFEDIWMVKNAAKLKSLSQISGLDKLKFEDVQRIKALVTKGDSSAKITKKEMTTEEKAVEKENKLIWDLKEKLKENVSTAEMKACLEGAGQPTSGPVFGGPEKILDRLADAMLFGWLPKCSQCKNGDLIISRGRYKCTGHISEFARCDFSSDDIARLPWSRGKGCSNDFLSSFKFKPKKTDDGGDLWGSRGAHLRHTHRPWHFLQLVQLGLACSSSQGGSLSGPHSCLSRQAQQDLGGAREGGKGERW
eukprot:RCo042595